jgi:hypothetical protein
MNVKIFLGRVLVPAAILAIGAVVASTHAQDAAKPNKRTLFMRQKLEFSKNILEGLTTENFDLIAKNAKNLRLLSQAAEWEVPFIPDVDQYLPYTAEFQRIADDLAKKAKQRNLAGSTLAFNRMTISCVDCHEYVRDVTR